MRPTVRLCALLGFKLDFLDRLEPFPDDHFHHRSLRDQVIIFLQNDSNSANTEKKSSVSLKLIDFIVFGPLSTAVETIIARPSQGNTLFLIEVCEWAEIFIRNEFNLNPPLSSRRSKSSKFPFQSDLKNSWFQLPITKYI